MGERVMKGRESGGEGGGHRRKRERESDTHQTKQDLSTESRGGVTTWQGTHGYPCTIIMTSLIYCSTILSLRMYVCTVEHAGTIQRLYNINTFNCRVTTLKEAKITFD